MAAPSPTGRFMPMAASSALAAALANSRESQALKTTKRRLSGMVRKTLRSAAGVTVLDRPWLSSRIKPSLSAWPLKWTTCGFSSRKAWITSPVRTASAKPVRPDPARPSGYSCPPRGTPCRRAGAVVSVGLAARSRILSFVMKPIIAKSNMSAKDVLDFCSRVISVQSCPCGRDSHLKLVSH